MGFLSADATSASIQLVLTAVPAAVFLYSIVFVIQRLYFHPLAKYPGPKLAALTYFYEYWFEAWNNYEYLWAIKKMHEKYGPIVRINPSEIHIDDPDYYDQLNSHRGKWNKDAAFAQQFANPYSSVGTVEHDVHKKRRAAVMPFFSKQKILELEPVIQSMVDKLCNHLDDYVKTGDIVPLRWALKSFSIDTVAEYCFASNGQMIDAPNFAADYWKDFEQGLHSGLRGRYLPRWFIPSMQKAPAWIRASIDPGLQHFEVWHTEVTDSVDNVQSKKGEDMKESAGHRTIFHEVVNSEHLPKEEKSRIRLIQEGGAMVGAGGETTSQVLGVIVFGLLEDPQKLKKLRDELRTIQVDAESGARPLIKLENLPFLTGCVKEGLRLRTGKVARQQRIPRDKSIYYKDVEIKPGTVCSMTPAFNHIDPTIYEDPHSFKPERWVDCTEEERNRLDKYLVAFSKGTRMCSGLTLAMAEIYMVIPALFTRYDMDLYKTTAWDTEMAVDRYTHAPLITSEGLRVKLKDSTF